MRSVLIANRGEIAVRIARACADLSLESVAVHAEDDGASLHVASADCAYALAAEGPAAYLNAEALIAIAVGHGCDAVHPGYGFLSEDADFSRRCEAAGLIFVGPDPETLAMFGDKARARAFAEAHGVPLISGIAAPASESDVEAFLNRLGVGAGVMIKAVSGGGGRGMRVVRDTDEVGEAYRRCASEAQTAFGNDALYAEQIFEHARHIEVQIIGDGQSVTHLGDRDCSLQRRHQKLLEIAPAPGLRPSVRDAIIGAAVKLGEACSYRGIGTVEFLLDAGSAAAAPHFAFLEVNPRVQVEHTVTEAITGVDLVQAQLRIAAGASLDELDIQSRPSGCAIQLRINMETTGTDGSFMPSAGLITAYDPPSGPGVRVDGYGYAGYRTSPRFDALLAKLVVHAGDYPAAIRRARRALDEFRIAGVDTNIDFFRRLLVNSSLAQGPVTTDFLGEHAARLARAELPRSRFPIIPDSEGSSAEQLFDGPEGTIPIRSSMTGLVTELRVAAGDRVSPGGAVAVVEAMKMEHVLTAPQGGFVRLVTSAAGDVIAAGAPLLYIEPNEIEEFNGEKAEAVDLDEIRPDLARHYARHQLTLDDARPAAVEKRRARGLRTARENVADLADEGSFLEYGALVIAAQRRRRTMEDLIANTPADGLITGIGTVNADRFPVDQARCMILAYDATVLAGTQGWMNHKKIDRMLALCDELRTPLVLLGEGGGGRPGDTDIESHGLEVPTFHHMARLSGRVPLVAIVAGKCFAGNAALVGCCDVIIATENANLGMGGPAMIEGGGLGVFPAEAVGPTAVHRRNGVADIVAADEADAVALAKKYLSYFQGREAVWECSDQRQLRRLIPENRVRGYDVREIVRTMADEDSVLELRREFGVGILTALIRVEGRPMGLVANNPLHLGGAIDGEAAGKAARFVELCDAFALPIVNLIDTPGFMVGPAIEETAQVRRVSQMLVVAASTTVPMFNIVLRKAYGLGALGIGGGSFHAPVFTVAWPTGEVGGMNLEGAVRLAYRKELDAIVDPVEQKRWFDERLAEAYELGTAQNAASFFQLDAIVDPSETRSWIVRGLESAPQCVPAAGRRRPFISVW